MNKLLLVIKFIYTKLPWRIQQIMKIIFSYIRERPYPHSDFPLIGKKKSLFSIRRSYLNEPLVFNNAKHAYYSRIYSDSRNKDTDLIEENASRTAIEILPCDFFKTYQQSYEESMAFQVANINNFGLLNVELSNGSQKQKFELNDNGRFISLAGVTGSTIKIESSEGFILSPPIARKQKTKNKRRLVLCLFVDGLVDRSILEIEDLSEMMPNTAKFFDTGFDFRNHHVNSDWTLPSIASIFSGRYTHNHGLYDPHKIIELGGSFPILSEYFKESQYVTFNSGGSGRISPAHGYTKGFDRTIYRALPPAQEVIANFFEHNRVFYERDQFAFLQFNDLHHNLSIVPDYSVMNSIDLGTLAFALNPNLKKEKSVHSKKNVDESISYIERIKRLDYYLNTLYQHIENYYDMNEVSVSLFSDHGQSFLTSDEFPLSNSRTKTIFLLRSGGKIGKKVDEFTEGVDIFNTVLSDAGISFDANIDGNLPIALGGLIERKYSFSQSIYPGQTYKAVINSTEGKYIYETEMPVDANGVINHVNSSVKILSNSNISKKIFTENQVKEIIKLKLTLNN